MFCAGEFDSQGPAPLVESPRFRQSPARPIPFDETLLLQVDNGTVFLSCFSPSRETFLTSYVFPFVQLSRRLDASALFARLPLPPPGTAVFADSLVTEPVRRSGSFFFTSRLCVVFRKRARLGFDQEPARRLPRLTFFLGKGILFFSPLANHGSTGEPTLFFFFLFIYCSQKPPTVPRSVTGSLPFLDSLSFPLASLPCLDFPKPLSSPMVLFFPFRARMVFPLPSFFFKNNFFSSLSPWLTRFFA